MYESLNTKGHKKAETLYSKGFQPRYNKYDAI
jgi:hypothetical protein